jgi:hypothetical protein
VRTSSMALHASSRSSYVGAFRWYAVLILSRMYLRSSTVIRRDQSTGALQTRAAKGEKTKKTVNVRVQGWMEKCGT